MIGFGTVGTGVAKILMGNAAVIQRRVGVPVELVRIADLDTTRDRGVRLSPGLLTADAKAVLEDPAVDIVLELIGGYDTAKRVILELRDKTDDLKGDKGDRGDTGGAEAALRALEKLGYTPAEADSAVRKALAANGKRDTADIVKAALGYLSAR